MSTAVLQQGTAAARSMRTTGRIADHMVAVESWRVVTEATGDAVATADAIVRVRSGRDRLVVTEEASTAEAALLGALKSAEKITSGGSLELGRSLRAHLEAHQQAGNVAVEVIHQQGLVGRLAVLLNAHQVTSFSYRVDPEQQLAVVEMMVLGGDWQVSRAANKLRRVIGVLHVTARLAGDGDDTVLAL